MNAIDKKPNYKVIYNFVKNAFNSTIHFYHGPFDETYYTLRVYESSKEIISRLRKNVPIQVILVASILHDVGKTKVKDSKIFSKTGKIERAQEEWDKHPELGVPIAKEILKKLGHSNEFIEKVCHLVKNHDLRDNRIKSLELQILQDADLIADCGFAGFIRPFLYGSKFKRQIIGCIKYMQQELNQVEKEGLLNLNVSKQIAKRKMKIEKRLIKEISKDIDSDLL